MQQKYKNNVRLILIAAAVIIGLWFAFEIINVLFLFFFAVVLTLVLNTPTMWLVSKNVPRTFAALIVFFYNAGVSVFHCMARCAPNPGANNHHCIASS